MAATPEFANVVHPRVISHAKDERVAASKLIAQHILSAATPPLPSTISRTHAR
jgi:hypothetical protein